MARKSICLVYCENKSPFISAWLGPVARQHYTEEASELVKHEQTDERVPKQGFLFGSAFYMLELGAQQEKDGEAQVRDRRLCAGYKALHAVK